MDCGGTRGLGGSLAGEVRGDQRSGSTALASPHRDGPASADRLWEAHEIESTVMNARSRGRTPRRARPDLDRAVCPGELAADTAGVKP